MGLGWRVARLLLGSVREWLELRKEAWLCGEDGRGWIWEFACGIWACGSGDLEIVSKMESAWREVWVLRKFFLLGVGESRKWSCEKVMFVDLEVMDLEVWERLNGKE